MTLNELVPTYGKWGGPGWSAGERTPEGVEPDWTKEGINSLDNLFRDHDHAYWNAENESDPVTAAKIIFNADVALLRDMQALKDNNIGLYGELYQPLATVAFGDKSLWDIAQIVLAQLDTLGGNNWKNDPFPDNHTTIPSSMNNLYTSAKNWSPPRADPLVLDLDRDGIETIGIGSAANVLFDHDGDGVKTATGWVKADDGMLVLDRNGNGTIDNGGELFGDQTLVGGVKAANGFAALSAEDTNKNGKFDAGDANFTKVRIWQDLNQDGISQAIELKTLTQAGVASINLGFIASNIANDGNIQRLSGTYIKTDKTSGQVGNYLFTNNAFYRKFTDHLTLSDTAKALPDMQGSGMVRDLQEASTLSAGLTSTLQGMKTTYMTHDEMMVKLDSVLTQWANTSSMLSGRARATKMGGTAVYMDNYLKDYQLYHKYLWAQQHNNYSILTANEINAAKVIVDNQNKLGGMIDVLERFNASSFSSLIDSFELLSNSGTRVSINTSRILEWYPNTADWVFTAPLEVSMSSVQSALLKQSYESLKQSVYDGLVLETRLSSYLDAIKLTISETGLNIDMSGVLNLLEIRKNSDAVNTLIDCAELNNAIRVAVTAIDASAINILDNWFINLANNDAIAASITEAQQQFINSLVHSNYKLGSNGDNNINTSGSNDIVFGLGGNDTITSRGGNERLYGGSGNDILNGSIGNNVLNGGTGTDTMSGGLGNDTYYVDNTADNVIEVNNAGIDTINSSVTYSLAGQYAENLILTGITAINASGNSLNNTLTGNSGNNLLDGSTGIDIMIGGVGNDTYVVDNTGDKVIENVNEGIDTIQSSITKMLDANVENLTLTGTAAINGTGNTLNNTLTGNGGNNILDGGTGADRMIGGTGNDTYIVDSASDLVYENVNAGIDTVQSSVSYALATNVENLTLTGTAAINGTGNTLNNTLTGNGANNVLKGGAGADTMIGGAGNDTYVFNIGDGIDSISDVAGNDTLVFGTGITKEKVAMFQSGSNLMLSYGTNDLITIANQSNVNNAIEKFALADGNYLTSNDMNLIIQSMNAYATDHGMSITSIDSVKANQDLMNIVAGAWHK